MNLSLSKMRKTYYLKKRKKILLSRKNYNKYKHDKDVMLKNMKPEELLAYMGYYDK